MKNTKFTKPFFLLTFLFELALLTSCQNVEKEQAFTSNFSSSQERSWIGPEYWSNPLQDWQIKDGELQCLVSNKNRNVHLLTKKIDSAKGDLKMSVEFKLHQIITSENNKDWVGFSIGSKGQFNDYRDNAIFGKGLNVGISTYGNLFIGSVHKRNTQKETVQEIIKGGAILDLKITPEKEGYQIVLSLMDKTSNQVLQKIEQQLEASQKLDGDVVLVSHYNTERSDSRKNNQSVSFKNWQVSGSKISTHSEYVFGPVLFSQYTLSRNTLKITAQMAPVIVSDEKVYLEVKKGTSWETIGEAAIDKDARTATFKITNWEGEKTIPYRISYKMGL